MMDFRGGHIVTWILLLIAASALIYFLVRASQTHNPNPPSHETPLDILKRRYAQGEITKAQFEEVKKDL
jgi:putative membrane protein